MSVSTSSSSGPRFKIGLPSCLCHDFKGSRLAVFKNYWKCIVVFGNTAMQHFWMSGTASAFSQNSDYWWTLNKELSICCCVEPKAINKILQSNEMGILSCSWRGKKTHVTLTAGAGWHDQTMASSPAMFSAWIPPNLSSVMGGGGDGSSRQTIRAKINVRYEHTLARAHTDTHALACKLSSIQARSLSLPLSFDHISIHRYTHRHTHTKSMASQTQC